MRRSPTATYRLQFSPDFTFRDAIPLVRYLSRLGISHIYASPVSRARRGSTHGYDVVDQNQINPELGSEEEFFALTDLVHEHRMGWIQDIVPNHMAYSDQNPLICDILENGPYSRYYNYFDIEWDHPDENIRGRVLAPFLGGLYGTVLENGELTLSYDGNGFSVRYYEMSFPLRVETYVEILTTRLTSLESQLGREDSDFVKLLGVFHVLRTLGEEDEGPQARSDKVGFVKRMLWELYSDNQTIRSYIHGTIQELNGEVGRPESFTRLSALLWHQVFRLSYWKVATEEINYRRFFSINDLISLRMESEEVFDHTHQLVLEFIGAGRIDGLRVDHIDGLYDPATYLKRLRARVGDRPVYVEKILDPGEELPGEWPVDGTTGYDFLAMASGLFCDRRASRKMISLYRQFTTLREDPQQLLYSKKRLITANHMAGDMENMARFMRKVFGHDRHGIDIPLQSLKRALMEVMVHLPVYRTYVTDRISRQADRAYIREAVSLCRREFPSLRYELDYIERFLLLSYGKFATEESIGTWNDFVMRFQQFSGPLTAKGVEDTFMYVYSPLVSLNEVGGDFSRFGTTPTEFHRFARNRNRRYPAAMNTGATHDSKRGEDMRLRISVLSQDVGRWSERVRMWRRLNRDKTITSGSRRIPDRNDEYFIYQTLIGMAPFGSPTGQETLGRLSEYLMKAIREAKVHTAWIEPDEQYEAGVVSFLEGILDPERSARFVADFQEFHRSIAFYGMLSSLSQVLLKMTTPGFPDFYQGGELWDFSLVDPDNRRPVDYALRKKLLAELPEHANDELLSNWQSGAVKLFVIARVLAARHASPALFDGAAYTALKTGGTHASRILAFSRQHEGQTAVVVVPRLTAALTDVGTFPCTDAVWKDTTVEIPDGRLENVFTGETAEITSGSVPVATLLARFPVGLWMGTAEP